MKGRLEDPPTVKKDLVKTQVASTSRPVRSPQFKGDLVAGLQPGSCRPTIGTCLGLDLPWTQEALENLRRARACPVTSRRCHRA